MKCLDGFGEVRQWRNPGHPDCVAFVRNRKDPWVPEMTHDCDANPNRRTMACTVLCSYGTVATAEFNQYTLQYLYSLFFI
jgi:hypothetical protein